MSVHLSYFEGSNFMLQSSHGSIYFKEIKNETNNKKKCSKSMKRAPSSFGEAQIIIIILIQCGCIIRISVHIYRLITLKLEKYYC